MVIPGSNTPMKDFDGNPITKDSRELDYDQMREWQKKNPGTASWSVRSAIRDAKYQALKEYKKKQRQAARRIPTGGNKFEGKDLSFGNFKNAKISYGNFNGANLEWSDLSDVDFQYANLIDANLSNVDAQDVNLSRANLKGADLSFATLDLADLRGAGLTKVNFGPKIITSGPNKGSWEGRAAHMHGANFNRCHLWNSSFLTSDFGSSDFRKANFHGSDFRASYFKRANFAYATIDDARGLDKIWKNDKFGSLKFIPHKNQPNTANPNYDKPPYKPYPPKDSSSNPKLWGSRAQLSQRIKDENGNPFLPDHDKAIKAANRVSKTPQLTYLAESDEPPMPAYEDPHEPYAKAVVIIDNSGSTAVEDTGMTDKKTGHHLNRLDRHVMTAATYLGTFPDSGEYRIITPNWQGWGSAKRCKVEDFDNTADAIDYLFTLTPRGSGFIFPSDEISILSKDYGNVLLIQDEPLSY